MAGVPFDFRFLERFSIPLKRVKAGEKIFAENDPGDRMYVVMEGKVDIVVGDTVVETVGLHGIFGELALIDNAPRSATARAAKPAEVAVITETSFLDLVSENPAFSLYVMRQLAKRIRTMNTTI